VGEACTCRAGWFRSVASELAFATQHACYTLRFGLLGLVGLVGELLAQVIEVAVGHGFVW